MSSYKFRCHGGLGFISGMELLGSKLKKKLYANTYLIWLDHDTIAIRYHRTNIITMKSNGETILNNDDWYTVTTKQRMNDFLQGIYIHSVKGEWIVSSGGETFPYRNGQVFKNGLLIRE